VNRSLTEGRRRFFERFGEIASGTACRRYQPLLSAACDGHTGAEDERLLRAHLVTCAGCRATLREYRTAPARLAELLPPAVVLPLLDRPGFLSRIGDWVAVTAGERATALGLKLQQGAEVVGAQKAAAVVASTAAIAGGGVAVQHADPRDVGRTDPVERADSARPVDAAPAPQPPPAQPDVAPQRTGAAEQPAAESRPAEENAVAAREFGFEGAAEGESEQAPAAADSDAQASSAPARAAEFPGPAAGAQDSGGGEFGP
jgi:hypothetical protein